MPTLDWIGKKYVVNHHNEVPFHLLECDPDLSVGDPESNNLIVQGDNLLALKALLPYYAGQVKCIYIDPPYNTGNEKWIYNDNVNNPEVKKWLGNIVGKEAEDLSRHDKWLCMMYPRLRIAQKFLSDDGVIFVSIDDNAFPYLRILLDDVFGRKNQIATFVWQTEGNFDNQAKVKIAHEYILAYALDIQSFPPPPVIDPNIPQTSKLFKKYIQNTIVKNGPKNPVSGIELPVGFPTNFKEGIIQKRSNVWPHYEEDLIIEDYKLKNTVTAKSGWSSKKKCLDFIDSGFQSVLDTKKQDTKFVLTHTGAIESVKKRAEDQSHVISVLREVGTTQSMSAQLAEMGIKFDYPKPTGLISYLISMVQGNDFIVLDFFAGSGTTADAVLSINSLDDGKRNFILVELEKDICREITNNRIKNIVNGYVKKDSKNKKTKVDGLGGGSKFCSIGENLFDTLGQIAKNVSFIDLARFVFFKETGLPLPDEISGKSPLIGIHHSTAVYLLYNGILGDKTPNGGNALTRSVLAKLPAHNGQKVIYGTSCRIGHAKLRMENIIFRQIPYELKVD
jgi:adenine-specific DNA-methyltransferase